MTRFYLLTFSLIITCSLDAQVSESLETMSLGQQNALVVDLPYTQKFALNVWRDYIKDFKGKTKKVKRSDELFTDDATVSYLSSNTVDIYSVIDRDGSENSTLKLWIDLGGGFVSSNTFPDAYEGSVSLVEGYQKMLNVEDIKLELKAEQSKLKDLQRELTKLERLNDRYHKEIETWKEKIAKNEELIVTNVEDQESAREDIDSQAEAVKAVEIKLANAESN